MEINKHIKHLNKLFQHLNNEKNAEKHRQLKRELVWHLEMHVAPEDACEVISKWLLPILGIHHINLLEDHLLSFMNWINLILDKNINIDNSVFTLLSMLIPKLKCEAALLSLFSNQNINAALRTEGKDYVLPALQCFDVILTKVLQENQAVEVDSFEMFSKNLLQMFYQVEPINLDVTTNPVFLLSSLRVLSKLCTLSTQIAQNHVSELLGISQAYLLYGQTLNNILPHKIYPSQQAMPMDTLEEIASNTATKGAQAQKNGGLLQKKRKPKAVQKNLQVTRNDDEQDLLQLLEQSFSDLKTSESDNDQVVVSQQQRQLSSKVRLTAIGLLGVVLHAQERRQIYGYWHILFPTQIDTDHISRSDLLYVSQHDPNVRCRSAALQISARLIFQAKSLLSQAEISNINSTTSFMPFSQHLGMLLLASYDSLCKILAKEASYTVLTQALKSLAMLVQATPFKRLKCQMNLVFTFVQHVRPLVYHRNDNVQLAALMVMEFLLLTPEITLEITEAIGYKKPQLVKELDEELAEFEIEEEDEDTNTTTTTTKTTTIYSNISWLLLRVLANLETLTYNPLLVQNYKVLNAMSTHFELLLPQLPRLAHLFRRMLSNSIDLASIHVAHCLNSCTHHMNLWISLQTHTQTCVNFWLQLLPTILEHSLPQLVEAEHEEEEAVIIINALSNMGAVVYEQLPRSLQMQLLCCLTNYGSVDNNVGAAAIRALAIYANYPALHLDFVFLENTVELALNLVQSKSVLIRSKSFWALSSISDALILSKSSEEKQCLSDHLFRRYLQAAVEASKEQNDKINCSAVHILGNLLSLVQHASWLTLLYSACNRICSLTSTGTAKTRWNACYALSIMWRNKLLFTPTLLPYQFEIYETLCSVIINDQNFKVRINASNALQQISERAHFGNYFMRIWSTLLNALEQSNNLENFYEYNHRDKLQEQLCLSICQMLKVAELEDMIGMCESIAERLEVLHNTWMRVTNRLVPELAAPLMACSTIVMQKNISPAVSKPLQNAIEFIAQAFNTNSNSNLNNI